MNTDGYAEKAPVGARLKAIPGRIKNKFLTKDGLVGDYDYAFLFTPNLPFMRRARRAAPFFGLNDRMPVVLAIILGFQHSLAMLAGVITPPILLSGASGVALPVAQQQYLVSTSLIVCGFLSMVQITRFHIRGTPYFIGTGLLSVAGVSFATIPVASGAFSQMYANGFCPTGAGGVRLPCPDAYGRLIATSALCALTTVFIAFIPPRIMLRIFPPIVTGPVVLLIGVNLIKSALSNWMGSSGPCSLASPTAFFAKCPNINSPNALPWGSAQYLGLGFSVYATIILSERYGAPIMKSCAIVIGLLVGCIIAAATGYFDKSGITSAPAASFPWVYTFKLEIYPPLILPLMAVFVICSTETIGDITATCDVSRLEVEGKEFESRIQGGLLSDGLNSIIACMATVTAMTTFAQNNAVVALTKCANRSAGYWCCMFLIIMGIFAKFAAAIVAIPPAVLGGMTTFLFSSVAISGFAIISRGVPFNRRNRFILTAAMVFGFGATMVPTYFATVFTYSGDNRGLRGFMDAIVLIMETGYAISVFITVFLNFFLPEEIEDVIGEEAESPAALHKRSKMGDVEKGASPEESVKGE